MRDSLGKLLAWAAAILAVGSLYANGAVEPDAESLTPTIAVALAGCLAGLALLGLFDLRTPRITSTLRMASAGCVLLALIGFAVSMVASTRDRDLDLKDWGLFALQAGTPVLLFVSTKKRDLLQALGLVCVAFAAVDMIANFAGALGLISLPTYSGRLEDTGIRIRYPGLSGNTHAAGLVAFVAVSFLAWGFGSKRWAPLLVRAPLIAGLLGSLWLIDARRYLGMALVAVIIAAIRPLQRIPPALVAAGVAGVALESVFVIGIDVDDVRVRLLTDGAREALSHPFLGDGALYRDPAALAPVYEALAREGVTESSFLDFAIAYGLLATGLFFLGALLALCAKRERQTWPVFVLALATAEFVFGTALTGFLGALLFYASLAWVWGEDERTPMSLNPTRGDR